MIALGLGGAVAGLLEDGSVQQMAANVAVMPLAIFVSIVSWKVISTKFYDSPVRVTEAFGLKQGKLGRCLLLGLVGGGVIVIIAPIFSFLTGIVIQAFGEAPKGQELVTVIAEQTQAEGGIVFLIFFAFMAVIVAPIGEEILFRGILYPAIKQNGYPKVAAVGTAFLFGLFHLNLLTFVALTFVGFALIYIYEHTDNLLAPIIAHAFFNGVNVSMILVTSKDFPEPGLIW